MCTAPVLLLALLLPAQEKRPAPLGITRAEVHITVSRKEAGDKERREQMEESEKGLRKQIDGMGDDVLGFERQEPPSQPLSRVYVVQVKAGALRSFLGKLKDAGLGNVWHSTISEDVDRYQEIQVRLKADREEEARLKQRREKDNHPVDELLSLTKELRDVRGRIATQDEQRQRLEQQSKKATVTIHLSSPPPAESWLKDLRPYLLGGLAVALLLVLGWNLALGWQWLVHRRASHLLAQRARSRRSLPTGEIHVAVGDLDSTAGQLQQMIRDLVSKKRVLDFELSRKPSTCIFTLRGIEPGDLQAILQAVADAQLGRVQLWRTWDRSHDVAACLKTEEEIEESLRGLLKSGRKEDELVSVRKMLNEVRRQIEEQTAQLEQPNGQPPRASAFIHLLAKA